jgi:SOS response regulatory protein OraA/RecX
MDLKAHGAFTFTEDLTDVQSLSDGGYLTITTSSGASQRSVDIRSSGGRITRSYSVNGSPHAWDDEARRWLASELPRLVRRTGFGAESRVKSIFQKKGVAGVMDEVALLEGDYVRRVYLSTLIDVAHLDSTNVLPVLAAVRQRMTSDYDRGQVLQRIAHAVKLDQRAAQAYVESMRTMRSDYERRRVLTALLETGGSAAQSDALFNAIDAMTSSYDRRMVLSEILRRPPLDTDVKKGVLTSAAGVRSDYDRAEILVAYVRTFGVEPALRDPFFAAVQKTSSDYDRRRVLTELASKGSISREVQQSAFESVRIMRSDYDRAEVLLAFLNARAVDPSTRAAFVSAAESIRSSHDQNRVLAALVKAEAR